MKPTELVNIMFSPQWVAKLQYHMLSGAQRVRAEGIKIELLYLALPFLSDNTTRLVLISKNKSSTYSSVFLEKTSLDVKNSLINKKNEIKEFKSITNNGFIYLSNITSISMNGFLKVDNPIKFQNEEDLIRNYCKAAHNLGIIFAKEDYKNIFLNLDISEI